MTKRVRFAVVGCGAISPVHINGILEAEHAELVAVCDIDKKVADRVAEKYDVKKYYHIDDLVKDDQVDVINICTPSSLHYEQTILAANNKKHVIVEKPMAIHLEHIQPMIDACNKNNVLLGTIFPRRMAPQVQYIKNALENNVLGKLSLCSAYAKIYRSQDYYDSAGWRGTWEYDGGGAMMNQGIHTVDLLQWLIGPVKSLYGKADAILRNIEVEDTAISLLEFENGALGTLEITTTATINAMQRLEIYGEKGSIIIIDDDISKFEVDGEDVKLPDFDEFKVIPDGHKVQIQDFINAINENRAPIVEGADGKHSLEIILGTYKSSKSEEKVHLS